MTLHRTPVREDYQIDMRERAACGEKLRLFRQHSCGCAVEWADRIQDPVSALLDADQYNGIRSYIFPSPMDRFSIYLTFDRLVAVESFAYPTLKWRIQLGIGPENERAVEGSYTPEKSNETGLLLSFCSGTMFSTLDFCANVIDPSGQKRPLYFVLGGQAMLATTCFPIASTGENGTITYIRPPTQPTPVIIP